jgi:hypothetical protein
MRKEKPPPVHAKLFDQRGNLSRQWLRWFQEIGMYFDDYRKSVDITSTGDLALTTDDFGKSIVFNNGTNEVTCNLPTVSSKDLHCWVGPIYRLGTGKVIITADPACKIEYSSLGGSIYCNEERRAAANVTLELVSTTQWGIISGTGIWKVE